MSGFRVTRLTHGAETRAEWSYDGPLRLTPEPLLWRPGARDAEDAANMALSVLLPIAVAAGESVMLPYALAKSSLAFWNAKFRSLQRFYRRPCRVRVGPLSDASPADYEGDDKGLCWGCGVDSMGTLCAHLDAGVPLHLVALREIGMTPQITIDHQRAAATAAGMPLTFVETNANTLLGLYSRLVADRMVASDPYFFEYMPPAGDVGALPYIFTRGFVFFFAALCAVPRTVRRILYSYASGPGMDYGESHANGFCFYDDTAYRGAKLVPFSAGGRIEMVQRIFTDHPTLAEHIRVCASRKAQWCGNCVKCAVVHLAQRVLGLQPIRLADGSLSRRLPLYQVSELLGIYRREPNSDEELETLLLKLLDRSASHGTWRRT